MEEAFVSLLYIFLSYLIKKLIIDFIIFIFIQL